MNYTVSLCIKKTRRNRRQSVSDVRGLCCWNQWHPMRFVMQDEKKKKKSANPIFIYRNQEGKKEITVQNADNTTKEKTSAGAARS